MVTSVNKFQTETVALCLFQRSMETIIVPLIHLQGLQLLAHTGKPGY